MIASRLLLAATFVTSGALAEHAHANEEQSKRHSSVGRFHKGNSRSTSTRKLNHMVGVECPRERNNMFCLQGDGGADTSVCSCYSSGRRLFGAPVDNSPQCTCIEPPPEGILYCNNENCGSDATYKDDNWVMLGGGCCCHLNSNCASNMCEMDPASSSFRTCLASQGP